MYFANFHFGLLLIFCIGNIQAKPFFFNAYQDDEGFGNDLDEYFIDLDSSRTPILSVNPFVLPADNGAAAITFADGDESAFVEVLETPVVYVERFESAFDEAAGRLESMLRLAVKNFKESFMQTFEIINNSSAIEETLKLNSTKNGENAVSNITSTILDVNKEKDNVNKMVENNTVVSENENKGNMAEDNTNKPAVEKVPVVGENTATTAIKSSMDAITAVDSEVKSDAAKVETESLQDNESKND